MRNLGCGAVLLSVVGAGACAPDVSSGSPDAAVRPDAAPKLPTGDHHSFAIDSIRIPTGDAEGQQLGLDVDGDGDIDNRLGGIINLLSANGADINATVTKQIDEGELIHLIDLQATALDNAADSALYVWKGDNPQPAPCTSVSDTVCRRHLDGNGSFDVTSAAPVEAMIFGGITGTRYAGSRGVIILEVPLFISDTPLTLEVIGARAEVDVALTGLSNGKLAGAVTATYLQESVLPQMHEQLDLVIARDCLGSHPSCCTPDTDGETTIEMFDSDESCTLELSELQESSLLELLLAPDVDLLDEEGLDGGDGVLDSMSLGVGFTAVPATYELPAGLP